MYFDGASVFARRTSVYLLVWAVSYGLTQLFVAAGNADGANLGRLTGVFSTAMLLAVSLMLLAKYVRVRRSGPKAVGRAAAAVLMLVSLVAIWPSSMAGQGGFTGLSQQTVNDVIDAATFSGSATRSVRVEHGGFPFIAFGQPIEVASFTDIAVAVEDCGWGVACRARAQELREWAGDVDPTPGVARAYGGIRDVGVGDVTFTLPYQLVGPEAALQTGPPVNGIGSFNGGLTGILVRGSMLVRLDIRTYRYQEGWTDAERQEAALVIFGQFASALPGFLRPAADELAEIAVFTAIILVLAGVGVNVATEMAASWAEALGQAAVQAEHAASAAVQDAAASPPPLMFSDGEPVQTNDKGQYFVWDRHGTGMWVERAEAERFVDALARGHAERLAEDEQRLRAHQHQANRDWADLQSRNEYEQRVEAGEWASGPPPSWMKERWPGLYERALEVSRLDEFTRRADQTRIWMERNWAEGLELLDMVLGRSAERGEVSGVDLEAMRVVARQAWEMSQFKHGNVDWVGSAEEQRRGEELIWLWTRAAGTVATLGVAGGAFAWGGGVAYAQSVSRGDSFGQALGNALITGSGNQLGVSLGGRWTSVLGQASAGGVALSAEELARSRGDLGHAARAGVVGFFWGGVFGGVGKTVGWVASTPKGARFASSLGEFWEHGVNVRLPGGGTPAGIQITPPPGAAASGVGATAGVGVGSTADDLGNQFGAANEPPGGWGPAEPGPARTSVRRGRQPAGHEDVTASRDVLAPEDGAGAGAPAEPGPARTSVRRGRQSAGHEDVTASRDVLAPEDGAGAGAPAEPGPARTSVRRGRQSAGHEDVTASRDVLAPEDGAGAGAPAEPGPARTSVRRGRQSAGHEDVTASRDVLAPEDGAGAGAPAEPGPARTSVRRGRQSAGHEDVTASRDVLAPEDGAGAGAPAEPGPARTSVRRGRQSAGHEDVTASRDVLAPEDGAGAGAPAEPGPARTSVRRGRQSAAHEDVTASRDVLAPEDGAGAGAPAEPGPARTSVRRGRQSTAHEDVTASRDVLAPEDGAGAGAPAEPGPARTSVRRGRQSAAHEDVTASRDVLAPEDGAGAGAPAEPGPARTSVRRGRQSAGHEDVTASRDVLAPEDGAGAGAPAEPGPARTSVRRGRQSAGHEDVTASRDVLAPEDGAPARGADGGADEPGVEVIGGPRRGGDGSQPTPSEILPSHHGEGGASLEAANRSGQVSVQRFNPERGQFQEVLANPEDAHMLGRPTVWAPRNWDGRDLSKLEVYSRQGLGRQAVQRIKEQFQQQFGSGRVDLARPSTVGAPEAVEPPVWDLDNPAVPPSGGQRTMDAPPPGGGGPPRLVPDEGFVSPPRTPPAPDELPLVDVSQPGDPLVGPDGELAPSGEPLPDGPPGFDPQSGVRTVYPDDVQPVGRPPGSPPAEPDPHAGMRTVDPDSGLPVGERPDQMLGMRVQADGQGRVFDRLGNQVLQVDENGILRDMRRRQIHGVLLNNRDGSVNGYIDSQGNEVVFSTPTRGVRTVRGEEGSIDVVRENRPGHAERVEGRNVNPEGEIDMWVVRRTRPDGSVVWEQTGYDAEVTGSTRAPDLDVPGRPARPVDAPALWTALGAGPNGELTGANGGVFGAVDTAGRMATSDGKVITGIGLARDGRVPWYRTTEDGIVWTRPQTPVDTRLPPASAEQVREAAERVAALGRSRTGTAAPPPGVSGRGAGPELLPPTRGPE